MSSKPPPAAAAASPDSDEVLARTWAALEQLTELYGFDVNVAKQAIDIVGPDVEAACAFILDSGMGQDKGGPVVPIDHCPHLEEHARLSPNQLVDASFHPLFTTCSHVDTGKKTTAGGAKVDTDDTTGACASTENWLCLDCGAVRCSRYSNGHGLVHFETTKANDQTNGVGHCLALSLVDLSVWCYVCGAYVHHPSLRPILQHLEDRKFGRDEDTKKPAI